MTRRPEFSRDVVIEAPAVHRWAGIVHGTFRHPFRPNTTGLSKKEENALKIPYKLL